MNYGKAVEEVWAEVLLLCSIYSCLSQQQSYIFIMTNIGDQIKRFRKVCGLSQTELGERLGVTYQVITNWERNCVNLTWRLY